MAKKQPEILLSSVRGDPAVLEEVCQAKGVYAIFFEGKPFTLRKKRKKHNHYEYQGTVYSNPGNAYRLKDQLNEKFETDLFTVEVLK